MSGQPGEMITADVRTSELLDRVVITPRHPRDQYALSGILKNALPSVNIHNSADGIWLASHDADVLHDIQIGIDLLWSTEARLFVHNRLRMKRVHSKLFNEVDKLRAGGRDIAETYLTNSKGLDVLDNHQWVNVAAMTLPEGYGLCIFDEQGAGKTVTLIFAFDMCL